MRESEEDAYAVRALRPLNSGLVEEQQEGQSGRDRSLAREKRFDGGVWKVDWPWIIVNEHDHVAESAEENG